MLIYRRYCMHTLKKILAGFLAVIMTVSVFGVSAAEALAEDTIDVEIFYGFGKAPGTQNILSGVLDETGGLVNTGNGYSIKGSASKAYTANASSGSDNAYSHPKQEEVDSVDVYYAGSETPVNLPYVISSGTHCIKGTFYYDSSNNLTVYPSETSVNASHGTPLITFAAGGTGTGKAMTSRWRNVADDVVVVLHYNTGHTININTGDENATFASADIPDYFYEKTANTGVIEIGGSTYSSTAGISTTVAPDAAPSKILITVGTGETVTVDDVAADVYLTSGNTLSNTHESTDILRYNAGEYTFYNVSDDINIAYSYSAAEYNVTFMAGGKEHETKTVAGGTPVVAPATDPEAAHKLFKGWYADEDCTVEYDFNAGVDADTVIYAKFVDAYEVAFTGVTSITSANWDSKTGGTVDADGILKTEGYAYDAAGVQVGGYFDIGSGNIDSVTFTFGGQTVTLEGEDVVSSGTIVSADGSHEVKASPSDGDLFKYAYTDGNREFFMRFYEVTQDIGIEVTFKNEAHVFYFSGQKSISGSTWASKTGGALNTAGKMTTPGNYVDDPATAAEANGTSKGANFALYTDPAYTVESITINYGSKTFTMDETNVTDTATKYMTATGAIESSWNSTGTTIFKYAHAASSMQTYNFRFFRITRDVRIAVKYAEVPETVTAAFVDESGVFSNILVTAGTDSTSYEDGTVTIYPAEMLGLNDAALENDTVQIQVAPKDTVVSGIIVSDTAGNEIGRIERGGTYTSAYVDGFGKMAMSYNANDAGGYSRYYIRFLTLLENVVITPIIDADQIEDSILSMGVEVGNTLTAKFFAELTDEIKAAGYDSYIFRSQLGSSGEVDLPGTVSESGTVTFSLEQIYAQCMSEKITGTLYGVKDGVETELDGIETGISVAEYCDKVAAAYPSNENLLVFMANMLNYGSECQKFVNYNTGNLAITGHDWADGRIGDEAPVSPVAADELSVTADGYDKTLGRIKAAGLNISNKIAVYFNVYLPDGADNFALTVDETPYDLTPGADGMCRIQLIRISPSAYDHVYTAELSYNGVAVQTVRYSVNTYCERKIGTASVGDLCKAIYNYGVAAESYIR